MYRKSGTRALLASTTTHEIFSAVNPTNDQQMELGNFAEAAPAAIGSENQLAVENIKARIKPPTKPSAMITQRSHGASVEIESLLTFSQAARALGISLRQFRRLVDGGKIAFVRIGERSPRVQPDELQKFLAASLFKYSEVQS